MSHEEQINIHGKDIIDAMSPLVKWKFDDFHNVLLAEFSVDKKDQAMFALKQALSNCWDIKSIKKAPPEVKHYAGSFSKLTKSQKLLSASLDSHPKVMVAWWPWGHGATISVRLFLTNTEPYTQKSGIIHKLTRLFA